MRHFQPSVNVMTLISDDATVHGNVILKLNSINTLMYVMYILILFAYKIAQVF